MPEFVSPTYRVFISSTFDDFEEERTALQKVWRELDEFCKERGARFEAVDLRWGISKQVAEAQRVMDVCREEVRRCIRLSPRPNFLVLVGERYGWEPLPGMIPEDEFVQMLSVPGQDQMDVLSRELLLRYYRLDCNALPTAYILQPTPRDPEWPVVENRLRAALRARVVQLYGESPPVNIADRYFRSAVHLECIEALSGQQDTAHVLACIRQAQAANSPSLRSVDPSRLASREAGAPGLGDLRRYLHAALPGDSIFEYVGSARESRIRTLQDLLERVRSHLQGVIELQHGSGSPDYRVVMERLASGFQGREQDVATILDHVAGDEHQPALCVVGPPGTGKTTLLAHCGALLAQVRPEFPPIFRSIGATPRSSHLDELADGLLDELFRQGRPQSVQKLRKQLAEQARVFFRLGELELLRPHRELLLFLDRGGAVSDGRNEPGAEGSVAGEGTRPGAPWPAVFIDGFDQLDQRDAAAFIRDADSLERARYAGEAQSFPASRVVISVADDSDIWRTLRDASNEASQARPQWSRVYPVAPVPPDVARTVLARWLADLHRQLTPAQEAYVLAKYGEAGESMLFLRLASKAVRWWDHTIDPELQVRHQLAGSVAGLVDALIHKLGEGHGRLLVRRTCDYITTAREGLNESELLSALRTDTDVVKEYEGHSASDEHPDRIPAMVWARLFGDMEPYLGWFAGQGGDVLRFFHRVVHTHIAEGITDKKTRHEVLCTVFGKQESILQSQADPGAWQPNGRKAAELLTHLAGAGKTGLLLKSIQDMEYLMAKCALGSIHVAEILRHVPLPLEFRLVGEHAERVGGTWQGHIPADYVQWFSFLRERGPALLRGDHAWGPERLLLQCALERPQSSPVRRAAESWIQRGLCSWPLVRGCETSGPPCWLLRTGSQGLGVLTSEHDLSRFAPRTPTKEVAATSRRVFRRRRVAEDRWRTPDGRLYCLTADPTAYEAGEVVITLSYHSRGMLPRKTTRVLHIESQVTSTVAWLSERDPTIAPGLLRVVQEGGERNVRLCYIYDWITQDLPTRGPVTTCETIRESRAPLPSNENYEIVACGRKVEIRRRGGSDAESEIRERPVPAIRVRPVGFLPFPDRIAVPKADPGPFLDEAHSVVVALERHEVEFATIVGNGFSRIWRWSPPVPIAQYSFTGDGTLKIGDVDGNWSEVWIDWSNVRAVSA